MYPNYSSISNPKNNNDLENQVHPQHNQHNHHHNHHHQHHQCNTVFIETRMKRKSGCCYCCSFPCLVIILVIMIIVALIQKHAFHGGWNTDNIYYSCNNMDSPNIQWKGISTYYVPQDIKYLQIMEINERPRLYLDNGNVKIVENNNLNQTRITFDLKISNHLLQDGILIKEKQNQDKLELSILHVNNRYKGCVKASTLIEIPSSSTQLNKLKLGYMNNEIRIKDKLILDQGLSLDVVNGDIIIESPIKTTTMEVAIVNGDVRFDAPTTISSSVNLAIVNGDIKGRFHLNQSKLDASVANGVVDLQFDSISPVSTISTSIVNGKIDIQVVNNNERKDKIKEKIDI
ncbi:unnamed protein product [Cunninghamella blakesleeana]